MVTTLDGKSLGKIQSWRNAKQGNIMPIPIPTLDSQSAQSVDMLGVIEFFDISVRLTGTYAEVQALLLAIKSLVDGNQLTSYDLISEYVITNTTAGSVASPQTISVKLMDFDYTWENPGLSYVDYTIKLVVGT